MPAGNERSASAESPLRRIPVFPPIALRLLRLVSEEDVVLGPVLDLLRSDPAFSAEILRRANSPLFGLSAQVKSLQHALVVLGFRRIRTLTLTVAARLYLGNSLRLKPLRRCWRHTLACAVLSRELAHYCARDEDAAYTAGLLHDIGRLGLMAARPEHYAAFVEMADARSAADPSFDVLAYEHETFGLDHCAAGEQLCRDWALPEELLAVIARHHEPPVAGETDAAALVRLGCSLADALGFHGIRPVVPVPAEEIRSFLPPYAERRFPIDPMELRVRVERAIDGLSLGCAGAELPGDEEDEEQAEALPATPALWTPARSEKAPDLPLSNGARRAAAVFTRDILLAVLASVFATALFLWLVRFFRAQ